MTARRRVSKGDKLVSDSIVNTAGPAGNSSVDRARDHLTRQQLIDLGADAAALPSTPWVALDGSDMYPVEIVAGMKEALP
jgi:hypothetical protein